MTERWPRPRVNFVAIAFVLTFEEASWICQACAGRPVLGSALIRSHAREVHGAQIDEEIGLWTTQTAYDEAHP